MSQEARKPINLSVHQSSDPSVISDNPDAEASAMGDNNDLNDSAHDDENVDVPTPEGSAALDSENTGSDQISIVNRSPG